MQKLTKKQISNIVVDYLFVTVAGILNGITVYCFLSPAHLIAGGFTGLSQIVSNLISFFFDANAEKIYSVVYIVLNIPLLVSSLVFLRGDFTYKTIWATLCCTATTAILPNLPIDIKFPDAQNARLISVIFAGVIIGTSMYIASLHNGSNGGTEIIGKIVSKYHPEFDLSKVVLLANLTITIGGSIVEIALYNQSVMVVLYSLLYVWMGSTVLGILSRGLDHPQKYMIVTSQYEAIGEEISRRFKRGYTCFDITDNNGNDTENKMIMVIIQYRQTTQMKYIIAKHDPSAFTFVKDMYDIFSRPKFNRSYKQDEKTK